MAQRMKIIARQAFMHRAIACGLIAAFASTALAAPLLPDLVSTASMESEYMYGGEFDVTSEPGRVLYRFNTAITNIGDGPFEVFEITDFELEIQDVYQHIFDSEGGFTSTLMGSFNYEPPAFGHLHLEDLALYNLREVTPGMGVGVIVASHSKTSHAVVDSVAIDTSLPAAPPSRVYTNHNANPLGISVGYADLYSKSIPKQRIDVTGIPSGQYWLEVVVDPTGYVQETDDTNNTTRILVDLTIPTTGDNDQDDDVDGIDYLLWQQGLSPNLGSASDYLDWEANFATIFPSGSPAILVPEPTSLAICLCCLLLNLPGLRLYLRANQI